jgi:hypothetical protein
MMYNHQIHWNFGLSPFEPVIKKTDIHPKALFCPWIVWWQGQMYMHVKALEYMVQSNTLPCNVKFMIEEEEIGSKVWAGL